MKIGLGWHWVVHQPTGAEITWHNGGTGGFHAFVGLHRPTRTGLVQLTNAHPADRNQLDMASLRCILKLGAAD